MPYVSLPVAYKATGATPVFDLNLMTPVGETNATRLSDQVVAYFVSGLHRDFLGVVVAAIGSFHQDASREQSWDQAMLNAAAFPFKPPPCGAHCV